jgi:hypothetical protein
VGVETVKTLCAHMDFDVVHFETLVGCVITLQSSCRAKINYFRAKKNVTHIRRPDRNCLYPDPDQPTSAIRIEIAQNCPDKNFENLDFSDQGSKGTFRGPCTTRTLNNICFDTRI